MNRKCIAFVITETVFEFPDRLAALRQHDWPAQLDAWYSAFVQVGLVTTDGGAGEHCTEVLLMSHDAVAALLLISMRQAMGPA
jgi:hypothetical protein